MTHQNHLMDFIMTVTVATFKIDGRHVSNMARECVLDGEWRQGLKMLIDDFEGMTHEIAFLILKGTHILEGVNDNIVLVEELDEDYQASVSDIYCFDMFYHDGELYRFDSVIEHREIQADVYGRGLMVLPDWDEYVRKYLTPVDMFFFDVSTSEHRFRACIASKVDVNSLPLWFGSENFCTTAKQFTDKHYPYKSTVASLIEKKMTQTTDSKESKWYKDARYSHAIKVANDYGFQSVEAFSDHWRDNVLKAIAERGIEWRELHVKTETVDEVVKYPYELALRHALVRTKLSTLSPSWQPVCPEHIKLDNDSAVHSDLWLALGNNFDGDEYTYTTKANVILSELVHHLQKTVFPAGEFVTLNSAGLTSFTGKVVTQYTKDITKNDILVIPHAGPEFELMARKAGLVISEVGGKLAHLVIVGREFGLPLVRVDEACFKFVEGMVLTLDFDTATINISY